MKDFIITETNRQTAVLVGIVTFDQDERTTNEYLDELEFLAQTAGVVVVNRFTQKLEMQNPVTYVGSGKLDEIADYIDYIFYKFTTPEKQNHTVSKKKGFGCLKDIPCKISPDFDEPLEEFAEYM